AALARLAMRGRVVLCGGIAHYNDAAPVPGPKNYLNLVVQRGRMEGFIVLDYFPRAAEAIAAISRWMKEGRFKDRVDVQEGLENAPATLARPSRAKTAASSCCASQTRPEARASTGRASAPPASLAAIFPDAHDSQNRLPEG